LPTQPNPVTHGFIFKKIAELISTQSIIGYGLGYPWVKKKQKNGFSDIDRESWRSIGKENEIDV
jgi:hypothetical protein